MEGLKKMVLETGVEEAFEEGISFRALKKFYNKKITAEIKNVMRKLKRCFIEVLASAMTDDLVEQLYVAVKKEICKIFGKRTEFPVKEILDYIDMGSTFLSTTFLNDYFQKAHKEFNVTHLGHGLFIQPVGFTKEHYSWLMKNKYELMQQILSENTVWDTLILAYDIWKKDCMKISTCLKWILTMGKFKFFENFKMYRDQVRVQLALRIMDLLDDEQLKIFEITDALCEDYDGFLSNTEVYDILETQKSYFVIDQIGLEISDWEVCISPDKMNQVKNANAPQTSSATVNAAEHTNGDFFIKLNEDQERRITPLLTLKVKYDNVVNIFKSLKKKKFDILIGQIFAQYGCFCDFLISYCKFQKPKLNFTVYRERLETILVQEIHQCLNKNGIMQIQQILDKLENYGTINRKFLMQTIHNQTELFRVFNETVALVTIDISEQQKHCMVDEMQLNEAGIFKVINLFIQFSDLQHSFKFINQAILADLEKNSMCFLEYLVSCARRYRQVEAEQYAKHVYMLLNEEVRYAMKKFRYVPVLLTDICSKLTSKMNPLFITPSFIIQGLRHTETDMRLSKDGKYIEKERKYTMKIKQEPISEEIKHMIPFSKFSINFQQHLSSLPSFRSIKLYISDNERYFARYVNSSFKTWMNLLLKVSTETKAVNHVTNIIKDELIKGAEKVIEINQLIEVAFAGIHMFTTAGDLVKFIERYPKTFILKTSEHEEYVVGVLKDLNANERLDFHTDLEQRALFAVLLNTNDTTTTELEELWKKLINEPHDIQEYLFGKNRRSSISVAQFEAYLSTYQCLFYVHRDNKLSLTVPGLLIKKEAIEALNNRPVSVSQAHVSNISREKPVSPVSRALPFVKSEKRQHEDYPATTQKRYKIDDNDLIIKKERQDVMDVKPILRLDTDIILSFERLTDKKIEIAAFKAFNKIEYLEISDMAKSMILELFQDKNIATKIMESTDLLKVFIKKMITCLPEEGYDIRFIDKESETIKGVSFRTSYRKERDVLEFFKCKTLYEHDMTAKEIVDLAFDYLSSKKLDVTKRKDAFVGYTYLFLLDRPKLFRLTNKKGNSGLTYLNLTSNETEIEDNECKTLLEFTHKLAFSKLVGVKEGIEVEQLVQTILLNKDFYREFIKFEPKDIHSEAHALICASMYRNPFHFPNNTSIVRIFSTDLLSHSNPHLSKIKSLKDNPKKLAAWLAIANIIDQHPCTLERLPAVWIRCAPKHLIDAFGVGFGFTLFLREYAFMFQEDKKSRKIVMNQQMLNELKK